MFIVTQNITMVNSSDCSLHIFISGESGAITYTYPDVHETGLAYLACKRLILGDVKLIDESAIEGMMDFIKDEIRKKDMVNRMREIDRIQKDKVNKGE